MSVTRIHCSQCGFPQCFCTCQRPESPSELSPSEPRSPSKVVDAVATGSRPFPMLDGPPIEWSEAEKVYELYACLFGRTQTLTRLAERGGFGHEEIEYIRKRHEATKARGLCVCANN